MAKFQFVGSASATAAKGRKKLPQSNEEALQLTEKDLLWSLKDGVSKGKHKGILICVMEALRRKGKGRSDPFRPSDLYDSEEYKQVCADSGITRASRQNFTTLNNFAPLRRGHIIKIEGGGLYRAHPNFTETLWSAVEKLFQEWAQQGAQEAPSRAREREMRSLSLEDSFSQFYGAGQREDDYGPDGGFDAVEYLADGTTIPVQIKSELVVVNCNIVEDCIDQFPNGGGLLFITLGEGVDNLIDERSDLSFNFERVVKYDMKTNTITGTWYKLRWLSRK